jgi:hypothetical protein
VMLTGGNESMRAFRKATYLDTVANKHVSKIPSTMNLFNVHLFRPDNLLRLTQSEMLASINNNVFRSVFGARFHELVVVAPRQDDELSDIVSEIRDYQEMMKYVARHVVVTPKLNDGEYKPKRRKRKRRIQTPYTNKRKQKNYLLPLSMFM